MQLFYNLSDPGLEDPLYEVESVRRFVGLRLTAALPDETTILNFRHLLEKHGLGEGLFEEICHARGDPHASSSSETQSRHQDIDTKGGRLIVAPSTRPGYIFDELLAQCKKTQADDGDCAKLDAKAVGNQLL